MDYETTRDAAENAERETRLPMPDEKEREYEMLLNDLLRGRGEAAYLKTVSPPVSAAVYDAFAKAKEEQIALISAFLGKPVPPPSPVYAASPRALVVSEILLLERLFEAMDASVTPSARLMLTQLLRAQVRALAASVALL